MLGLWRCGPSCCTSLYFRDDTAQRGVTQVLAGSKPSAQVDTDVSAVPACSCSVQMEDMLHWRWDDKDTFPPWG